MSQDKGIQGFYKLQGHYLLNLDEVTTVLKRSLGHGTWGTRWESKENISANKKNLDAELQCMERYPTVPKIGSFSVKHKQISEITAVLRT